MDIQVIVLIALAIFIPAMCVSLYNRVTLG